MLNLRHISSNSMTYRNIFLFTALMILHFNGFSQDFHIGDQTWMNENLRVTRFSNGDPITQAKTKQEWITANENSEPVWCYYNNDSTNKEKFGIIYNQYAVQDSRGLAPKGWEIPTLMDYKELIEAYESLLGSTSKTDTAKYFREMEEIKRAFRVAENDSIFASSYRRSENSSDPIREVVPTSNNIHFSRSGVFQAAIPELEEVSVGEVVGPYVDEFEISIYKVVGQKELEYASVRHILLKVLQDEDRTEYLERADSIIDIIESRDNFEEMVLLFSDDPGSINKGGVYKDFTQGVMVKNFNDFSFGNPEGSLGKVETNFGVHIIEVLDRKTRLRPVVMPITKKLMPTNDLSYYLGGNGEDSADTIPYFNIAPGGYRTYTGDFMQGGIQGVLWSSSLLESKQSVFLSVIWGVDAAISSTPFEMGFYVRCLKQ